MKITFNVDSEEIELEGDEILAAFDEANRLDSNHARRWRRKIFEAVLAQSPDWVVDRDGELHHMPETP